MWTYIGFPVGTPVELTDLIVSTMAERAELYPLWVKYWTMNSIVGVKTAEENQFVQAQLQAFSAPSFQDVEIRSRAAST